MTVLFCYLAYFSAYIFFSSGVNIAFIRRWCWTQDVNITTVKSASSTCYTTPVVASVLLQRSVIYFLLSVINSFEFQIVQTNVVTVFIMASCCISFIFFQICHVSVLKYHVFTHQFVLSFRFVYLLNIFPYQLLYAFQAHTATRVTRVPDAFIEIPSPYCQPKRNTFSGTAIEQFSLQNFTHNTWVKPCYEF